MLAQDLRDVLIRKLDDPGNCIDLWEDEGDAGFIFITDDDVRLAVSVGYVTGG